MKQYFTLSGNTSENKLRGLKTGANYSTSTVFVESFDGILRKLNKLDNSHNLEDLYQAIKTASPGRNPLSKRGITVELYCEEGNCYATVCAKTTNKNEKQPIKIVYCIECDITQWEEIGAQLNSWGLSTTSAQTFKRVCIKEADNQVLCDEGRLSQPQIQIISPCPEKLQEKYAQLSPLLS